MRFFLVTLLVCSCLNASDELNQSAQSNQQAIGALTQSFGIAQGKINSECVEPTADLMCNSTTATIVGTLGSILGQITSSGAAGSVISGAISGVSCMLIKCDTTESRNQQCAGNETTSVCMCPNASAGTSTGSTPPCKSGATTNPLRSNCVADNQCYDICRGIELEGCDPNGCLDKYPGDLEQCTQAIEKCDKCKASDNAKVDNTDMCDGDYTTCITSYKAQAKTRQTKCRSICGSMVALLTAANAAQKGVAPEIDKLQEQTTSNGNNSNSNTNNNNYSNNNKSSTSSSSETTSPLSKFLDLFSSNKNNNNSAATSDADTSASDSTTGSASGTSSQDATSGSRNANGNTNATAGGAGLASSSGGSSSGGSSSSSLGANDPDAKTKLKGLKKTSGSANDYLASSGDLFIQVSAIYSSNYKTGVIGKEIKSNVSKKKVRR